MIDIRKLSTAEDVEQALVKLDIEQASYEADLGVPADLAKQRVQSLVADARDYFSKQFDDLRSIPDSMRRDDVPRLAEASIIGSDEFERSAMNAIDSACSLGRFDSTPQAEIEETREGFRRQRAALEQALAAKVAAAEEQAARERREAAESAAQEALVR